MKIYHNPRCRKSRETLQIIRKKNIEPEIICYLDTPPDASTLQELVKKIGINPSQLVRKNEKVYKELFKGKVISEEEWIDIMVQYPKLIERPIVVSGEKAILGRPPENVLSLLSK